MKNNISEESLQDFCLNIKPKILSLQNKEPKGSIFFPAYNEEKYILNTIKSLSEIKTSFPIEILGVNNASSDRTGQIIKECGLKLIEEPKKGLCFARQAGLESAIGKIIFQTDADTMVPSTWVDAHLLAYSDEENVGCVGFLRFTEVHPAVFVYMNTAKIFRKFFPKPKCSPFMVGGANFSYLREVALRTDYGSFLDSNFIMEDERLYSRLKNFGNISFLKDKRITVNTSGRKILNNRQAVEFFEGKINKFFLIPLKLVNPKSLNVEDFDVR